VDAGQRTFLGPCYAARLAQRKVAVGRRIAGSQPAGVEEGLGPAAVGQRRIAQQRVVAAASARVPTVVAAPVTAAAFGFAGVDHARGGCRSARPEQAVRVAAVGAAGQVHPGVGLRQVHAAVRTGQHGLRACLCSRLARLWASMKVVLAGAAGDGQKRRARPRPG
jgi:hypothetical protein